MKVITVKTTEKLIPIPAKKYREFLVFESFASFTPTLSERKALRHAEKNLRAGKTFSYHELKHKLGFTS